jgi:hypothetical protein
MLLSAWQLYLHHLFLCGSQLETNAKRFLVLLLNIFGLLDEHGPLNILVIRAEAAC